jgi:hypothetical protein
MPSSITGDAVDACWDGYEIKRVGNREELAAQVREHLLADEIPKFGWSPHKPCRLRTP